jgi:hypothetical protein
MYMLRSREMNTAAAGYHCGTRKWTIHFIQKSEDRIIRSVKASATMRAKVYVNCCHPFLRKIEKALCEWLEDGDRGCHGTIQGDI